MVAGRNPLWAVVILLAAALPACHGKGSDRERGHGSEAPGQPAPAGSIYLAVLAKPLEVYPAAKMSGVYRVRSGCAMLNDDLLVLDAGAATKAGSGWGVRYGDNVAKRLVLGYRIVGGVGGYSIASLTANMNLAIAEPMAARCAAIARGAALVAPLERVAPPSPYVDKLYAAVQRENLTPPTLAPLSGRLGVVDQCLTLGGRLLALPTGSSVEFDADGSLVIRIAAARYLETVLAKPGDFVSGTGTRLSAERETPSPMARPLLKPIPARCRKPGQAAVLLNPGPSVIGAGKTSYSDPGSAEMMVIPRPSPPPPIRNTADCPTGSRLTFGICREPDGSAAPPLPIESSPAHHGNA